MVTETRSLPRCKCGTLLSQSYAQRMGECVACYLIRIRAEGESVPLTMLKNRRRQRQYNRRLRANLNHKKRSNHD